MASVQKITPFLWFDGQAEEAAKLYTSIFEGSEIHGVSPMVVDFSLAGQRFTALNGGPLYRFTEAISFVVHCETQSEIDYYWDRLSEGGDPAAQRCGWLKDRFGLSWQVVPSVLGELLGDPDPARANRAMQAMLQMKKLDIAALRRAHSGV